MRIKNLFAFLVMALLFAACDNEEETPPQVESATFDVTIENTLPSFRFLASGSTSGLLMPGESATFSFNAGVGTYLSFATMLVQSNDLFYAFDEQGLRLYDDNGMPTTGDVTTEVLLWDAGTEVNEEPGVGPNQAPRQAGPNTGDDENGTVLPITDINDGFTYPTTTDNIKINISHDGGTAFTVLIENVSGSSTLPSPLAPGVWVVHADQDQLFISGQAANEGLEDIAEDGNNAITLDALSNDTGYTSPLAPGVFAIHEAGLFPIFTENMADAGQGLEALAEDGAPSDLNTAISNLSGISMNGVFNTPEGASQAGPLLPGQSYTFSFTAEEGDYLSLATMLVHTNDLFYAFDQEGIALFNNGAAVSGDISGNLKLWDAGTEVNEYPGAGNNQPARGGGNSGPAENGIVQIVNDGFTYPSVAEAIKVSINVQQ
jgi:hypothetical protein